jgi:hypothetical protein
VPFGGGSYEIRLAGRLSDSVLAAFECEASGLTVSVEPAAMVLYGPVPDQAALGGLVDRSCRLAWRWSRSGGCHHTR